MASSCEVLHTQQIDGNVLIAYKKRSHVTIHAINGTVILIECKRAFVVASFVLKHQIDTAIATEVRHPLRRSLQSEQRNK